MRRYLAGDDRMRTADLHAALTDPGIAGIIFATGGSGAQRTLEAMDWAGLAGLPPKVLAGYSDVTAVLEAAASKLGWASLLSPMVVSSGADGHYSFALDAARADAPRAGHGDPLPDGHPAWSAGPPAASPWAGT